jgi:hypothetical protein
MSLKHLSVLISFLLTFTACAGSAVDYNMSVSQKDLTLAKKKSIFTNNMELGKVQGGSAKNPVWFSKIDVKDFKKALEDSLKNMDLYHYSSNARYTINAIFEDLKEPLFGFDTGIICQASYQVYDNKTNKIIYERRFLNGYTKPIKYLKTATESTVRENIKEFIVELFKL